MGLVYPSLVAFSQIDVKKIIAYSSVAHMNFSLIGLFGLNMFGLFGCFYMMLGHAITSGALFFGLGVLYDRYKTRVIFYYSGMVLLMPIFSILYFIFVLSNFAFPASVNFVGEFLILLGAFEISNVIIIFASFGLILSLIYSLLFYNRVFFGFIPLSFIRFYSDCIRLEAFILIIFALFVLVGGLFPNIFLNISVSSLLRFH
jgi:NADH:ubiquinone oxidoreductase subunit 4 (subunit M)